MFKLSIRINGNDETNSTKKTVITVLHDLNQACRYCDYLIVMKRGAVMAQGAPDEVMTEDLLKEVFDLDVIIHRDPISDTPMFILK